MKFKNVSNYPHMHKFCLLHTIWAALKNKKQHGGLHPNTPISSLSGYHNCSTQEYSRRSLTSEIRVQSHGSIYRIFSGQHGSGIDFSPSLSVFPCQHDSTKPP